MPETIFGISSMTVLFWTLFHIFVLVAIYIDLFLLNKDNTNNNMKLNLFTVAMWMAVGLGFGGLVWWKYAHAQGATYHDGAVAAMNYWTGYLLEQSLSVDNLFVFLVLFKYFGVDSARQRRALVWGIIAAILMRGTFILAAFGLIQYFHWLLYILGAFLIYTGFKLLRAGGEDDIDPSQNPALKLCRRFLPLSDNFDEDRFTTRIDGKFLFTPLLVVLVVLNATDVMFATDSIPAIFGITNDLFIVYTSNIFAVCGLRAMYFALAGLFDVFHLLKYGLAIVLMFIGVKMLAEVPIEHYLHLDHKMMTVISLVFVLGTLGVSIILSLLIQKPKEVEEISG